MPHPPEHSRSTDVFVTSNKRARDEGISDHEDGQTNRQKRGRRRSPTLLTRQSTPDVVFEDGACWRCKLLRLPVSI